jgi:hypothetical protein
VQQAFGTPLRAMRIGGTEFLFWFYYFFIPLLQVAPRFERGPAS